MRTARVRKLNTKHNLPVLREDDEVFDTFGDENDPQQAVPRFETGVERSEETVSLSSLARPTFQLSYLFLPGTPSPSCHLGICCGVAWWKDRPDLYSHPRDKVQFDKI